MTLVGTGCIGQSVLKGTRRYATHVATMASELLTIDRKDIIHLFNAAPIDAGRICQHALREDRAQELIRKFFVAIMLNMLPRGHDRAVLVLQEAWRKYRERICLKTDSLARLVTKASRRAAYEKKDEMARESQRKGLARDESFIRNSEAGRGYSFKQGDDSDLDEDTGGGTQSSASSISAPTGALTEQMRVEMRALIMEAVQTAMHAHRSKDVSC